MKTFNRNTVTNIKQAKKQAKTLRDLRKRGGNISIFEGSGETKPSYQVRQPKPTKVHIGSGEYDGWDGRNEGDYDA